MIANHQPKPAIALERCERASQSIHIWAWYLTGLGASVLISPRLVTSMVGLRDPGTTMWPRLCGLFILIVAYYCFKAARARHGDFIRWTIVGRMFPPAFACVAVGLGWESPRFLLIALLDLAGAAWTYLALKLDSKQSNAV